MNEIQMMLQREPITIKVRVCGIPAQARVYDYRPPELDFVLLDRRGYRAKWLERKAMKEGVDLEALVIGELLKDNPD